MLLFDLMESLRSALRSIRAHGFRSFLTTLGIIIGVAAVIATVSIIQGLQVTINQQFEGLGTNSILVQSVNTYERYLQGKISRITPDDYDMLSSRVEGIATTYHRWGRQPAALRLPDDGNADHRLHL
jgi:putative ABC transport system permease protein